MRRASTTSFGYLSHRSFYRSFRHYLVLVVLLSVLAIGATTSSTVQAQEAPSATDQVIALVNQQRAAHGCAPLAPNPQLALAAQRHSEDMAIRNYFNHTTPEGLVFTDRIAQSGYAWGHAAENLTAYVNTPEAVVAVWMNSPPHRASMLDCNLRDVGVGVAYQEADQADVQMPDGSQSGPFFYYWTMDMATPATP